MNVMKRLQQLAQGAGSRNLPAVVHPDGETTGLELIKHSKILILHFLRAACGAAPGNQALTSHKRSCSWLNLHLVLMPVERAAVMSAPGGFAPASGSVDFPQLIKKSEESNAPCHYELRQPKVCVAPFSFLCFRGLVATCGICQALQDGRGTEILRIPIVKIYFCFVYFCNHTSHIWNSIS